MAAVAIRGTTYPIVLPKLRDPRLHLAATITSLQVIGQIGFHFRLSIAQILISLGTCAVLELAISFRTQRAILWPASAMLTGNGVAFVLRVPGTVHGDWWTLRGWWIFVATSAVSLLSKYVLKWRGEHIFNPSNIGLVLCFLILGRNRADPLDFWWGPMSVWLVLALVVILTGGFAILSRLGLLRVALGFWASFAVGIGALALAGHAMTARWHLGPIAGFHFWWVLVTSPEVLVFCFFMITDPKTAPRTPRDRLSYSVSLGFLAALLIAPATSEFTSKVALLGSLAVVCIARALLRTFPMRADRTRLALAAVAGLAAYAGVLVFANHPVPPLVAPVAVSGTLPPLRVLPSRGVQTELALPIARTIESDLVASPGVQVRPGDQVKLWLEAGKDQDPPTAVAQLASSTYRLHLQPSGVWALASGASPLPAAPQPSSSVLAANRLTDVAPSVGLDFRQGSFRFGISNDTKAMMGGGVCWLDYNNDGWQDLFAVNSYSSADTAQWQAHGGLPATALYENVRGTFRNVSRRSHADLQVQGDGCVAADLNGDGRTDLIVTRTDGIDVLWNTGKGTFVEGARAAGITASGWYTGAAVADVNGDGRPDIFVAGYSDLNQPVANSLAGFPTNVAGVRDLLYLNEGNDADGRARFREAGVQAGLEAAAFRHGLGAMFTDVNGDGRPDLYVANDEDPNQLYVNVPWPGGAKADPAGLGFRFEERGAAAGVADPFAGMGVAAATGPDGGLSLFVTNSRNEPSAAFRAHGTSTFANARPDFDAALGTAFAGWGTSWVDLANTGTPDLVLTAGAIPVTSLAADAQPVRVLAPDSGLKTSEQAFGNAKGILGPAGLRLNGRGLAAADAGNDGRMVIAINTIGGKLVLLRPSGPSGHWLDVKLSRFSPGAVVTVVLPGGRRLTRTVQAGSSYLSSEDPRVHFGLGAATKVTRLTVRYPWGGTSSLSGVRADRIVAVTTPKAKPRSTRAARTALLAQCTPASDGRSIATVWDAAAVAALAAGDASDPVQARDLFDLAKAMRTALHDEHTAAARNATISYAAYRLLVWRASFGSNLSTTFGLLTEQLQALCYTPDFTSVTGSSPAAVGNNIAAAAISAGRRDGSLEAQHYADTTYTPQNAPLIVAQPGSTVHDPTFWQPLALAQVTPNGSGTVPAKVQSFVGAQWGSVRTFAPAAAKIDPGAPPFGDPSDAAYKRAALAVIKATAAADPRGTPGSSPLTWNSLAAAHASGNLAGDVRLYFRLNAALNDTAVAVWKAKRAYQAPRPISMIRYLAFSGQSSDPRSASYSEDGLPLVPGLTKLSNGQVLVRSQGRWVPGARWSPPVATPPSPGWVSERSAFAAAAGRVLANDHSLTAHVQQAETSGLAAGIETPADEAAGRAVGLRAAALVLARDR